MDSEASAVTVGREREKVKKINKWNPNPCADFRQPKNQKEKDI